MTDYTTTIDLLEALGIDPTTLGPCMERAIDALATFTIAGVRVELKGPWADILGWFQPMCETQLGIDLPNRKTSFPTDHLKGPWVQTDLLTQIRMVYEGQGYDHGCVVTDMRVSPLIDCTLYDVKIKAFLPELP